MNKFKLWFKVVIFGHKDIEGYTLNILDVDPIVGNHVYKGYELINPKTNKVLYRNVKDYGCVEDYYNPMSSKRISLYFSKNRIK